MSIYLRVSGGVVAETGFVPPSGASITDCWPAGMVWVDYSTISPPPSVGWTATEAGGVWTFSAPVAPAPTPPQQAMAAMSAGLAITSTGTPSLDATYPCDAVTQSHIAAEMIALLNSGGASFADGTASVAWPDMTGVNHTFNAAQGKAMFLAVGAYVAGLYKVLNGTLATLPANTATIA